MTNTARRDLDWLAFQYVTGEMASSDEAAFEARLMSDLDACDAVIRAMQLCETADAAFELLPPEPAQVRRTSSPSQHVGDGPEVRRTGRWRMVPSMTAVVCLVIAVVTLSTTTRPSSEQRAKAELARLWTESKVEVAMNSVEDSELSLSESGSVNDLHVPDWLLAALAAKQAEGDDKPQVLEN